MTEPEPPAASPELTDSAYRMEAASGRRLREGLALADLAHAVLLVETELIPAAAGRDLLAALLDLHRAGPAALPDDPSLGDAYTNRRHALFGRAPAAAGWLETGRPRREATTIAYLLTLRRGLAELALAVTGCADALLAVAADHLATRLPDYTYLQRAHPTTLAHYLLGFAGPMMRDLERLRLAFDHCDRSPAGAGSTNGSRLPLDRGRLARLLGFPRLLVHARDAMWQPDSAIEAAATLAAVLINSDRLAEDLQIWASEEFGFVELDDNHSRTSVIMPQKKNPYSLAYLRGVARAAIGRLTGVAALQATPSGQVDNRIFVYTDLPQGVDEAAAAMRLLAAVLTGLRFDTARMEQRTRDGFLGATDLAEVLCQECGLDAHTAHRVVAQAVRESRRLGFENFDETALEQAARAVTGSALRLPDGLIARLGDPADIIASRRGPGGASADSVRAMLAELTADSRTAAQVFGGHVARIDRAEADLIERAEALCRFT